MTPDCSAIDQFKEPESRSTRALFSVYGNKQSPPEMLSRFGVMQGRLLPPTEGRYQSHPAGSWDLEFDLAKTLGLGYIEFIVDQWSFDANPLVSPEGRRKIRAVVEETGVGVRSICADCLMEWPLHSKDDSISTFGAKVASDLLKSIREIGASVLVIPCVDQSALKVEDFQVFADRLRPVADFAGENSVVLALETDLAPMDFLTLIEQIESENVKINYDIGNSASLGFDVEDEFDAYSHLIADVHIKDRVLGGGSVPLGHGCAELESAMRLLDEINFSGPLIFQAWRGEQGVEDLVPQLEFFREILDRVCWK